jgi:hypothetical protein
MMKRMFALGAAGALLMATTASTAPHGGGGHGGGHAGGGHAGGGHVGGFHAGGGHPGAVHAGGYHVGGVHPGIYGGGVYHHPGVGVGGIGYGGYRGFGGVPYSHRYYGGYGLGYGYGGYGLGYGGYGYGGLGIWNTPWSSRYGYYGASGFFSPSAAYSAAPVTAPVGIDPLAYGQQQPSEWGLKVTDVYDGPAKTADLRAGDVILGLNQTRTQSFEELQQALATAKGPTEIVFINGESHKVEKLPITPTDGKIGVAVVPAALP